MTKYAVIRTDGLTEFTDRQSAEAYLASIENGIEIIEVNETPAITYPEKEVPCWRIRTVIELAGLKSQINALIDAMPMPDKLIASNAWEYGNTVSTSSPFVIGIKEALNLSDAQVFEFFIQAENLSS
jgi:hypothetical protein